jgi:hypothetical protein
VIVKGQDSLRAPTEFRFAVSYDNELMSIPLLKCVDDTGISTLTEGIMYQLVQITDNGGFTVKNDEGSLESYLPSRFRMG